MLSTLLLIANLLAAALEVETKVTLDLCTDYVWRGQVINDEAVLQPSIVITLPVSEDGSLSFNVWGNFDFTNSMETEHEFSEIDLIASYSHSFSPLGFEAGVIHYTFPHTGSASTSEVYLRASYEFEAIPLSFSLTGYRDFDEIDGFYGVAEIESNITVADNLNLGLRLSAGFGNSNFNLGYFGISDSSFIDGTVFAGLTYKMSNSASISSGLQYMYLFDDALKDTVSRNNRDKLTASFSVRYAF